MKTLYIVGLSLILGTAVHAAPPIEETLRCPDKYFMHNMVNQMHTIISQGFKDVRPHNKIAHIHVHIEFYVKQIDRPNGVECHYYLSKDGHQVSDIPMFEFFMSDKK